jgi:tetratricopeptide (TPR) repeat protein
MKPIFILLCLLLTSCAGTGSKGTRSSLSGGNDLEDDLAWVKNEDFVPVQEVPFNIRNDFFNEEVSGNAMIRETIQRAPENIMRRISSSEDPAGRIVARCYRGEFAQAEKEMDESLARFRSHPSYWNQVGTCYLIQGKHRQALLYYNRALDIEKTYAPAINNIGVIHFREGQMQRAFAAFQEASKINSFSLTPSYNLALLNLRFGFVGEAEQVFQALRRQNQDEPEIIHALATIALFKDEAERAASIYRTLDRRVLTHPAPGLNYAVALKMLGRTQEAQGVFNGINRQQLQGFETYYRNVEHFLRN